MAQLALKGVFQQNFQECSDFVTKVMSYGESWDSSCEKSWVLVQNQWVPVEKTKNSKLGLNVIRQLIWLQNSVLQFTELKIHSFYRKAQQEQNNIHC